LLAIGSRRIAHQHLGISRNGDRRRAQFLSHIGDDRALRSPVGLVVDLISRDTNSRYAGVFRSAHRGFQQSRDLAE
jgi:hypothetical protein